MHAEPTLFNPRAEHDDNATSQPGSVLPSGKSDGELNVTIARWHTSDEWMNTPSPYDYAPSSIQTSLLLDKMPLNVNHHTVNHPSVSDDDIRAVWRRNLKVNDAAALAAIAGENTTLEWILSRERRKGVIEAVYKNPRLDPRNLWDPKYRDRAALSGAASVSADSYLAVRISDVDLSDFVEILLTYPSYSSTRTAIAEDRRLDGPAIADLCDELYTRVRRRYIEYPERIDLVCNPIAIALLGRAGRNADPITLPMRTLNQMLSTGNRFRESTRKLWSIVAASVSPEDALEFLNEAGFHDGHGESWIPGSAMAVRRGMPPEWYLTAATAGTEQAGNHLAGNPDVTLDILRTVTPRAGAAFTRAAAETFGDDMTRWALALEFRYDTAFPTIGDLIDYVETACA